MLSAFICPLALIWRNAPHLYSLSVGQLTFYNRPFFFFLEIPEGTKQVCTTCFGRINKRIGQLEEAGMEARSETEDVSWTDAEVELLKIGLRSHGNNWDKIGPSLPEKTPDQCKKYFYRMRKKLQLDKIVMEYKKVSPYLSFPSFCSLSLSHYTEIARSSNCISFPLYLSFSL